MVERSKSIRALELRDGQGRALSACRRLELTKNKMATGRLKDRIGAMSLQED